MRLRVGVRTAKPISVEFHPDHPIAAELVSKC
jgi:hypothetical protein